MVSRSALIDRLLNEKRGGIATPRVNVTWIDMTSFEEDNLQEVDEKLATIDNEIWGKLIIMERGTRTAKAYIRSRSITVDGSTTEYDGFRLGLRRFRNPSRQPATEMQMITLGQGIDLSVDSTGNVYITNRSNKKITVDSQGMTKTIEENAQKIFDLRRFKTSLDSSDNSPAETLRHKKNAIIKIQLCSPCVSLLDSAVWLCLIHVIAVEMTSLVSAQSPSTSTNTSTQSSEHLSQSPSSSSARELSLPRWTAPLPQSPRPLSPHYYEECTRNGTTYEEIAPKQEPYSLPLARPCIAVSESSASSGRGESPRTSSRFTPNEKPEVTRSRGGVKKKMERDKSAGPCVGRNNHTETTTKVSLSSSIMDLRTLSNLRRPIYFEKPLSKRGGTGHLAAIQTNTNM